MKNENKKEFSIKISSWIQSRLEKIQDETRIPFHLWAESELIKAIYEHRDRSKNKPRKRGT